ncbi:hypothetical protein BV898_00146 [Hypsibius exemplaris]|uniref:Uncharacterized protein n=1 Tax=Hypsibius exemplaris TaxID=2072580 RepID=A0A1W0XEW5_HYPEX|nr:hypothetical protein BV898_00146 [Hypsibius exemplaris]
MRRTPTGKTRTENPIMPKKGRRTMIMMMKINDRGKQYHDRSHHDSEGKRHGDRNDGGKEEDDDRDSRESNGDEPKRETVIVRRTTTDVAKVVGDGRKRDLDCMYNRFDRKRFGDRDNEGDAEDDGRRFPARSLTRPDGSPGGAYLRRQGRLVESERSCAELRSDSWLDGCSHGCSTTKKPSPAPGPSPSPSPSPSPRPSSNETSDDDIKYYRKIDEDNDKKNGKLFRLE